MFGEGGGGEGGGPPALIRIQHKLNAWLFERVALPAKDVHRAAQNVVYPKYKAKPKARSKAKAKPRNDRPDDAEVCV